MQLSLEKRRWLWAYAFLTIPLVFFHVLFKDWIVRFETRMMAAAQKLIALVQNTRPSA